MSRVFRIGVAAAVAVGFLTGTSSYAPARSRLYPLTQCGPDLASFCPIHGYFDSVPFHYNLAIYPGLLADKASRNAKRGPASAGSGLLLIR